MSNEAEVFNAAWTGYNSAIAEENANYMKAQATGDLEEQVRASQSIAMLQVQRDQYYRMASEHAQSMQAAPTTNRYGLTPQEVEVAHNWTSDPKISRDEREKSYAEQKHKYQTMRATGQYRDDQGYARR